MKKVTIIIPVFNKAELTVNCLQSIYRYTDKDLFEIFIVDNNSTDATYESVDTFKRQYDNLTYFRLYKNYGYGFANNECINLIQTDYVLLLNNDTIVTENWLNELITILENDKDVGAVGSKLLFENDTIQHAGVVICDDKQYGDNLVARHLHYKLDNNNPYVNIPTEFQALTGACLLIRSDIFDALEGFDLEFYNGYEDIDLCFRIRELGYKIVYNPKSIVYHLESQSGAERFVKTKENIELLHKKWLNKIVPDVTIESDGKVKPTNNIIKTYKLPYKTTEITKLTSIILVAYNVYEYTKETIESIFEHTKEPFELILVDNNSDDPIKKYFSELTKLCSNVKLITNNENVGFPKAVNQALTICEGDFICIANNDILVTANWLGDMINHLESDESYGLCGGVTNIISGPQKIPTYYSNILGLNKFAEINRNTNAGKITEFGRLVFFHVLIKKEVFETIGNLDEQFSPGNFEDDDFCTRAKLAGLKAHILNYVFIHHYGSSSFKIDGGDAYKSLLATNRQKFIDKWGLTVEQIFLNNEIPKIKELK